MSSNTPTPDAPAERPTWRRILERMGRQAAQTAVPIIAAASASYGTLHWRAATTAVGVAVGLTFLKNLAGIRVDVRDSVGKQLLDRAVPAFAGTMIGFIPVDVGNVLEVDWSNVTWASVSAAVIAVLAYYITPPSSVVAVVGDPMGPDRDVREKGALS